MKSGDFVLVDYIGRIKESGEIFDLTKEEVARKENIFNEKFKYGSVPMVIDSNFVLKGLSEALKEMKVGEKKTVEISPEKGFGERNPEFIKLIPESRFKEQNIEATPGSFVTINKIRGRVMSADGGRVRADFNHPLAGKTLQYELEIVGEIAEENEKVKAVTFFFTGVDKQDLDVICNAGEAEVKFKNKIDMHSETKQQMANEIIRWIKGIERVKFVDVFEKTD
jgi:FKBP-type peptidyl-prolyl cis-trans isomerase SlyD